MLQIKANKPTLIQFNKKSLYPSHVSKDIASGCLVEMVMTIGKSTQAVAIPEVNMNECTQDISFPFKAPNKLRTGEWTFNVYMNINSETFKYTNLANVL